MILRNLFFILLVIFSLSTISQAMFHPLRAETSKLYDAPVSHNFPEIKLTNRGEIISHDFHGDFKMYEVTLPQGILSAIYFYENGQTLCILDTQGKTSPTEQKYFRQLQSLCYEQNKQKKSHNNHL
ncbi:MAG: hypothetical protein WA432_01985 [Candidatus Babeliaceae bacterium]